MPRIFIALLLATSLHFSGNSQEIYLSGFGGTQYGGKLYTIEGLLRFKPSGAYGGGAIVGLGSEGFVEFTYSRQDTRVTLEEQGFPNGPETEIATAAIEYYQVGVARGVSSGGILPYGLLSLGAVRFHPKDNNYPDEWKFSMAAGIGVWARVTDRIGFRLQLRALMPIFQAGVGIICGTGGCGGSVSASTIMVQGDFTGGITIRLK